MREVVYAMYQGNAYIKTEHKPTKEQIMKLGIDPKEVKKEKKLTPKELENIKQELLAKMNK